jgi:sigma-B regulation protein RsbU (phosphoserine phosphatase)
MNRARRATGHLDLFEARILVADESKFQRALATRWLRAAGYANVVHAADGDEALRLYYEFQPDLMLVDIALPGLDGIALCRTITARHAGAVAILVQSGLRQPDDRVRAFNAGAVDFVAKPVHPPELVARVRMHLANRLTIQYLSGYRARLRHELTAVRLMQESLLPSAVSLRQARDAMHLDIAARCEMSSELGGDIWGLRQIDESRLGVYLADFTGHDAVSAMNVFRLHSLLGEAGIRFERPELVLQALNVRLSSLLARGSFATLFYAVIDTKRDRLDYAAAGAPPPVLIGADGAITDIDSSGVPIGIKHWQSYDVRTLPFPPGASLFLYSDALTEAPDRDGRLWDGDRLQSVLGAVSGAGAANSIEHLTQAFNAGRTRPLPDDLTLVLIDRIIGIAAHS